MTTAHLRDLLDDNPNRGEIVGHFEKLLLENKELELKLERAEARIIRTEDNLNRTHEQNIAQIKKEHHFKLETLESNIKSLEEDKTRLNDKITRIYRVIKDTI